MGSVLARLYHISNKSQLYVVQCSSFGSYPFRKEHIHIAVDLCSRNVLKLIVECLAVAMENEKI
jgi:hypothetical protein